MLDDNLLLLFYPHALAQHQPLGSGNIAICRMQQAANSDAYIFRDSPMCKIKNKERFKFAPMKLVKQKN